MRRKIDDIDRDLAHVDSQINSAQKELSRAETDAEDKKRKMKQLAADGFVPNPPSVQSIPNQRSPPPQFISRKTSGSVHSESTEEQKNHVIKVLEHESKLYHFEKNFLNIMSQNKPTTSMPKMPPFKKASSPIYQISENKPF